MTTVLSDVGLVTGTQLNYKAIQRAIRDLYQTGQYERVGISCDVDETSNHATLVVEVKERPILTEANVVGVERLSPKSVRDRVDLGYNKPLDPATVATAVQRIDSLYEKNGYYLAKVTIDSTQVAEGALKLTFTVNEGRRLAVSGIRVSGNDELKPGEIAGAMKTHPEGFWWWRKGEFDEDKYAGDLSERLPLLYAKRGFIDFRIAKDTLIIDRDRGKALVDIAVDEGPRYKVGEFEVIGNRHYSSEELARFYPFGDESRPLMSAVTDFLRRKPKKPKGVFDQGRWEDSKNKIQAAYATEGYIYANVRPVVERRVAPVSLCS